ncbi:MAG: hypothetical protein A4E45_00372 [Methanosaeta sp. PtaB.Bin039]|nr:MAG: hypothetical protein A4E45_00372 [Methanosaeta sp. PtaB.Bin039]
MMGRGRFGSSAPKTARMEIKMLVYKSRSIRQDHFTNGQFLKPMKGVFGSDAYWTSLAEMVPTQSYQEHHLYPH